MIEGSEEARKRGSEDEERGKGRAREFYLVTSIYPYTFMYAYCQGKDEIGQASRVYLSLLVVWIPCLSYIFVLCSLPLSLPCPTLARFYIFSQALSHFLFWFALFLSLSSLLTYPLPLAVMPRCRFTYRCKLLGLYASI